MSIKNVTMEISPNRSIEIETGRMANLAAGSVIVKQGDSAVLVTACSADPRPGIDFFPLQVDYREKYSAAGKFPGGYFKREGRPTEKEILTSRMTDRPLRPLFPKGFIDDVQIMASTLSADGDNETDVLSILGASAALMISDIPFNGPIGAVRVGRVDGKFIANPLHSEMKNSDLDLVYAGIEGKAIMIEGEAKEISEEVLRDAMIFADKIVCKQIEAQHELATIAGKPKREAKLTIVPEVILNVVEEKYSDDLEKAMTIAEKSERGVAIKAVLTNLLETVKPEFDENEETVFEDSDYRAAVDTVSQKIIRSQIFDKGFRVDGRGVNDLRPISCEVGLYPMNHGSALFTRGETQSLVTATMGSAKESQRFDAITGGKDEKRFMLHYNFPNYSVGETGRIMGPGRREVGHGNLAERSIASVVNTADNPYAIRCVSDIMGSNGSSSMASICGASLALMDAGLPIEKAVAGISCGLVTKEGTDKKVFLLDILGSEDHFGDMDFKVAGTRDGITGFQLDLKIAGLDLENMYKAMLIDKEARMKILDIMDECISEKRAQFHKCAPQIAAVKINPEKIGALIGPGGKIIRGIVEETGANIDIEDDGTVNIFAENQEVLDAVKAKINEIVVEPEEGKIYRGTVKGVKPFGAFVEILPGCEGLVHISELADYRVKNVEEICKLGDTVTVKCIGIDNRGKISLSRKAALAELD